jgi:5-formyltetrahydrofolate cyclo-ligase
MLNNEKSILRGEFKEHAEDFFADKSKAEIEKIHLAISEKLGQYCQKLFKPGVIPPQRIAIYEPMKHELPVRSIVEAVDFLKGADFLYPEYDSKDMWFLDAKTREKAEPDFILVPGLYVDREGHRLGRGRGYYDRYLKESPLPKERRVFLGYPFQFLEFVPTNALDTSVAFIDMSQFGRNV